MLERRVEVEAQRGDGTRFPAEVRRSRARLVETAYEARRRIERDLHDGAQQQLVSVAMTLASARSALGEEPGEAGELLGGGDRRAEGGDGGGLGGLADRVAALGRQLTVASRPGEGTTVRAEIPCEL